MMKMKFSTGSSSSSVASDTMSRKSTLCIYAEMDNPIGNAVSVNHCEKMNSGSEMMELRRELDTVHRALHQQSESVLKHRHQVVELTQKLFTRDGRVEREKKLREDQLAAVLRSLYLLEARLKKEQKEVQKRLKQKDIVIQSQQEEIVKLKTNNAYCKNCQQILGFTSEQTNIETDPEFLSLESMDSRCHNGFARSSSYHDRPLPIVFQKNTRLSKSFQSPKPDAAYVNTSSSEEGNRADSGQGKGTYVKNKQAFVRKDVVRRSRKYSGRKHNSTYLNTIQKRYSSHTNSSSTEDGPGEREKACSRVYVTGDDTADEISHDIQRASNKIDWLKEKSGKMDQKEIVNQADHEESRSFGSKMDRLHGIKRQTSEDIISNRTVFLNNVLTDTNNEKPWYANISDPEPELECEYNTRSSKLNYTRSKSADNLMTETFDDGVFRAEVVAAKNEVLCKKMAKKNTLNVHKQDYRSLQVLPNSNSKYQNECENENWYASASDQDDGVPCEIYKNNPVLECVNQILLQNSLDESSNDTSKSSDAPSPRASTKKVQFSTLNSISFDSAGNEGANPKHLAPSERERRPGNKIVKFSLETASEHSYEVPNTVEGYNYEIQSIYSNDYEPIVTKGKENVPEQGRPIPLPRTVNVNKILTPHSSGFVKNIAANIESSSGIHYYIDMEARERILDKVVNKRKVPRTPPALPPKPKNLVSKFRLENCQSATDGLPGDSDAVVRQQRQRIADVTRKRTGASEHNQEPDYCSISEINVPVVANGKREMILTQPTVEIHAEQFPQHSPVRTSLAKVATVTRLQCTKPSDRDIPKLPQVTEIIIPEEELETKTAPEDSISPDRSFILNKIRTSNNSLSKPVDARNSIQMGNSVSNILSQINRGANFTDRRLSLTALDQKCTNSLPRRISSELPHVVTEVEVNPSQTVLQNIETNASIENDQFDLSQNFEEFKLEDCEFGSIIAEEYRISSESDSSDIATEDITVKTVCEVAPKTVQCENVINNYRIEFSPGTDMNSNNLQIASTRSYNPMRVSLKNGIKLSNKPDLLSNIENVETESVRNSDIESSNSSASNSGSYNTVKCDPNTFVKANETHEQPVSFDFFLESSGLSSKSIMTPSRKLQTSSLPRPLSSIHKNVLRPKDVKIRNKSQLNATNHQRINDKTFNTAVKYFEPYL